MKRNWAAPLAVVAACAAVFGLLYAFGPTHAPPVKWPVGKETTVVDGPLDADGYVDYEAALNERLGKGVTPETNANVLLWKKSPRTGSARSRMSGRPRNAPHGRPPPMILPRHVRSGVT